VPDLLTHVLFGISIGLLVKKPVNRETILLVSLGSIVIDIERPIGWLAEFMGLDAVGLTAGFHSLLGAVVLSFAAASAFENTESDRGLCFRMILLGALTHLFLDMTMGPWEEYGVYLFYPLTIPFSFHLFWSDYAWYPVFGIIALCVVLLYLVITHELKPNLSRRKDWGLAQRIPQKPFEATQNQKVQGYR